jgi:hypothetical protein
VLNVSPVANQAIDMATFNLNNVGQLNTITDGNDVVNQITPTSVLIIKTATVQSSALQIDGDATVAYVEDANSSYVQMGTSSNIEQAPYNQPYLIINDSVNNKSVVMTSTKLVINDTGTLEAPPNQYLGTDVNGDLQYSTAPASSLADVLNVSPVANQAIDMDSNNLQNIGELQFLADPSANINIERAGLIPIKMNGTTYYIQVFSEL